MLRAQFPNDIGKPLRTCQLFGNRAEFHHSEHYRQGQDKEGRLFRQAYGILVPELRAYARNDLAKTKGKKASEQLQKGRAGRDMQ